jgi:hypothetical protein
LASLPLQPEISHGEIDRIGMRSRMRTGNRGMEKQNNNAEMSKRSSINFIPIRNKKFLILNF